MTSILKSLEHVIQSNVFSSILKAIIFLGRLLVFFLLNRRKMITWYIKLYIYSMIKNFLHYFEWRISEENMILCLNNYACRSLNGSCWSYIMHLNIDSSLKTSHWRWRLLILFFLDFYVKKDENSNQDNISKKTEKKKVYNLQVDIDVNSIIAWS